MSLENAATLESRLQNVVCATLKIEPKVYHDELAAGDIPQWDSLGHVNLLAAVEAEFRISLDVSDAIEVESIADLQDVVRKYLAATS